MLRAGSEPLDLVIRRIALLEAAAVDLVEVLESIFGLGLRRIGDIGKGDGVAGLNGVDGIAPAEVTAGSNILDGDGHGLDGAVALCVLELEGRRVSPGHVIDVVNQEGSSAGRNAEVLPLVRRDRVEGA